MDFGNDSVKKGTFSLKSLLLFQMMMNYNIKAHPKIV